MLRCEIFCRDGSTVAGVGGEAGAVAVLGGACLGRPARWDWIDPFALCRLIWGTSREARAGDWEGGVARLAGRTF